MNTKLLMASSAIFLALMGLCLTFLATEIADYFLVTSATTLLLLVQVLGALYFGFAMLNWMAKESVIGGIYNRPIAIANFTHFLMGGLALLKGLMNHPDLHWAIWMVTGLYLIFAVFFSIVFFRSPVSKKSLTAVN